MSAALCVHATPFPHTHYCLYSRARLEPDAFHACSPTRSALQSGRLPLHVNTHNSDPTIYNATSATGTGSGIPRNMTGVATKLRAGGYATHFVGKWDAGMATPDHTPRGRGYHFS